MAVTPLQVQVVEGGNVGEAVLRLDGALVMDNVFGFQKTWRELGAANIVVDLTQVPYVDSCGIGSLVQLHVSREKVGGTVRLVGVSDRVKTVLMVTKVDRVLQIADANSATA